MVSVLFFLVSFFYLGALRTCNHRVVVLYNVYFHLLCLVLTATHMTTAKQKALSDKATAFPASMFRGDNWSEPQLRLIAWMGRVAYLEQVYIQMAERASTQ